LLWGGFSRNGLAELNPGGSSRKGKRRTSQISRSTLSAEVKGGSPQQKGGRNSPMDKGEKAKQDIRYKASSEVAIRTIGKEKRAK